VFEVPEIAVQLLESKTESKEAFYRVARQIARKTLAAKRGDLPCATVEDRIDGVERLRIAVR